MLNVLALCHDSQTGDWVRGLIEREYESHRDRLPEAREMIETLRDALAEGGDDDTAREMQELLAGIDRIEAAAA